MSVERPARLTLRVVALGYLAVLLLVPVGLVFYRTFEKGLGFVWDSITTPAAIHALFLTLEVAAITVPLNAAFGVLAALALVRGRFPGRRLLDALIDLPFAISPVVVGLSLLLAYGVVLSTARAIGEFGAVSVVSGKIAGETETLTLLVEKRFQNFDLAGAYAASALLALIALATLLAMSLIGARKSES